MDNAMELYTSCVELQNNGSDSSPVEFCMICLGTDCKLYPLDKYNLDAAFKNLTGIDLQDEMRFVPQFCTECAQRLASCAKFRDKIMRAHQLLSELGENSGTLTLQQIRTINRKDNGLLSNIVKRTIEPDSYDLCLIRNKDYVQKIDVKVEEKDTILSIDQTNLNYDIKFEENLINEELDDNIPLAEFSNDGDNKNELNDKIIFDNDNDDVLNNYDSFNISKVIIKSNKSVDLIKNKLSLNKTIVNNRVKQDSDNKNEFTNETKSNMKAEKSKMKNRDKKERNTLNRNVNNSTKLKSTVKDRTECVKTKKQSKNLSIKKDEDDVNLKNVKRNIKTRLKGPGRQPASKADLKLFEVTEMSREEQIEEILRRKETENYKISPYKCTVCYKGFVDIDAYDGHMDRHTDKFGKFECSICGIRAKDKNSLSKHVAVNHSYRYHCMKCTFVTNYKNTAIDHGRWHDGKQYTCPHCDEVFTKQTSYMSHVRIKHPSDHVCTLCGYSFIGERGLKLHMNIKHRADDTQALDGPRCEDCNIRFACSAAYEQHMKVSPKHTAADKLKPNCPPKKYQVVCKKRTRAAPRKVDCEQCGMQLVGGRNYAVHFRMHHPDKNRTKYSAVNANRTSIMCELCGKVLPSLSHLRYHMPFHAEQKQFKCDVCDKRFAFKRNLTNHAVIHNEARPRVECTICGKNVSNKNNLWRHMFSHKDTRPYYKCEVCDKNFTSVQGRNEHVLHVHSNVPRPKRNRAPRPGPRTQTHGRHGLDTSDSQEL